MQVDINGHDLEITPALKTLINGKLDRLERHALKISSIHVTLLVEKLSQIAEAVVRVPGAADIHARSDSEDMYKSIDTMINKLDRQLIKHKEKHQGHH